MLSCQPSHIVPHWPLTCPDDSLRMPKRRTWWRILGIRRIDPIGQVVFVLVVDLKGCVHVVIRIVDLVSESVSRLLFIYS